MKKVYAIFSAVVICASALVLLSAKSSNSNPLFEANIEALAMDEAQSNDERVWYVDVKDKYSITCTLGGKRRCK
mgnify:CR=1 FL=1